MSAAPQPITYYTKEEFCLILKPYRQLVSWTPAQQLELKKHVSRVRKEDRGLPWEQVKDLTEPQLLWRVKYICETQQGGLGIGPLITGVIIGGLGTYFYFENNSSKKQKQK